MRYPFKIYTALIFSALTICITVFCFEAYVVAIQKEGEDPLPPLFGNFPEIRKELENSPEKPTFTFAVVGDILGFGTFEEISRQLGQLPMDFCVLLGDCAKGTEFHHRYFRAELADECAMPFPVFYVVGNHDVDMETFPVSRFEKDYGPSIFSFEYQNCLFVVLRILNPPFNNSDSLNFLNKIEKEHPEKYRKRFVFMHIPPPISDTFQARRYSEWKELISYFKALSIDMVFAGDFHGYARVQYENTDYIITGGGGSPLDHDKAWIRQFHHAVIVTVNQDRIAEQILTVPRRFELEDYLERVSLANVYPWMIEHKLVITGINIFFLALMILAIFCFKKLRVRGTNR